MNGPRAQTVFIVDDDKLARDFVQGVVEQEGLSSKCFSSAEQLLHEVEPWQHGCVVSDFKMPGMSGLELQRKLAAKGARLPVLLVTAHGDVPMAVQAIKSEAVDVLEKPVHPRVLLQRIHQALNLDQKRRKRLERAAAIRRRIAALTPREREIMDLVVSGYANKQIASKLDLSIKTVEAHRGRVMKKVGARTLAELVQLACAFGTAYPD